MSGMIEKDEVLAVIAELKKEYPTHSVPDAEAKVALRKVADKIRAIDAVEVVRGEWIVDEEQGTSTCSNCGIVWQFTDGTNGSDFCPNCGAKMNGEREGK